MLAIRQDAAAEHTPVETTGQTFLARSWWIITLVMSNVLNAAVASSTYLFIPDGWLPL